MSGSKIVFGEPGGGSSSRISEVADVFLRAGFDAHAHENIREEICLKLLWNACFNPVRLLVSCATVEKIDHPNLNTFFVDMLSELLELGHRLGIHPKIDQKHVGEGKRVYVRVKRGG